MELVWNGSHLGEYTNSVIVTSWKVYNDPYMRLQLTEDIEFTCQYKVTKDKLIPVVDELKKIFGIPRRGTHTIIINKKHYVLFKCVVKEDDVLYETPLHKIPKTHEIRSNKDFRDLMRLTICYCELLSLSSSHESSIRVRRTLSGKLIPINYNMLRITRKDHLKGDIGVRFYETWMNDTTTTEWLTKYIKNRWEQQNEETDEYFQRIMDKIQTLTFKIVERVDKKHEWVSSLIVSRLSKDLMYQLNFDTDGRKDV